MSTPTESIADEKSSEPGILKRSTPLPPVPEGMSKKQWKKIWKKQQFQERKKEYADVRRAKRKRSKDTRRALIKEYEDRGEEVPEELKRAPRVNVNQQDSGIKIVLDCSFDDLMNDKEVVSLSNQITRAYSANRRADHFAHIKVSSFDKRLKVRFEGDLHDSNFGQWKNFEFVEDDHDIKGPDVDKSKLVYLTADTEEKLETLEPGMTYIVGGIVDKNRHKALCYEKAKELGIPTRRLPIDQYIQIEGRRVLTTTHVVQLMLKYFDNRDWKEAFESVLPPRKLELKTQPKKESSSSADDVEEKTENNI
ncbi:hypothetical protein NCAS_0A08700 [Naumovozyma castellii]|uniref:tRNA (guanine(9)-N1)-methyltransferase n=1 Tax=Naumovozyma castellii TaxID=27288 RepID=G0V7I0_NAUCA|nr:hypothetical protein NCAS_0A08700 [Naumovozyma castellii CBS 4309]CCC67428.1 hypothetical protein NCAS_0A08700 [Naumovozyma castellii CBS 4309]